MSIVFLNGDYLPIQEAKISPLDRGFLFGDGIYEVIPSYSGRMVGFEPHIDRMKKGLSDVAIGCDLNHQQWRMICEQLIAKNDAGNLGIYLHVSRGADNKRFHGFPDGDVTPTVFAYTFEIAAEPVADKGSAKIYKVRTTQDMRWEHCDIKSTALLGNVLHFQQGLAEGYDETLLYNHQNELTEASACNVFIVKRGVVLTPPLDSQILAGITRQILINILRKDGSIPVEERVIFMEEVHHADEVWVTSSSKEIVPVVAVDGVVVGDGEVGDVWLSAQALFSRHKYHY